MIGLRIHAFPVHHGIPCYGFRIELDRSPVFEPEKARALGVPVKEWKRLQGGESVRVGLRRIHPEEVTGRKRKGISMVFSTDTRPCETLEKYCRGADLLILEGMYGEEEKRPLALKNHHMLFSEAAEIARRAGADTLVLTHFSTSLEDPEPFLPAARALFDKTCAARDGMIITMQYPKDEEAAWIGLS